MVMYNFEIKEVQLGLLATKEQCGQRHFARRKKWERVYWVKDFRAQTVFEVSPRRFSTVS